MYWLTEEPNASGSPLAVPGVCGVYGDGVWLPGVMGEYPNPGEGAAYPGEGDGWYGWPGEGVGTYEFGLGVAKKVNICIMFYFFNNRHDEITDQPEVFKNQNTKFGFEVWKLFQ